MRVEWIARKSGDVYHTIGDAPGILGPWDFGERCISSWETIWYPLQSTPQLVGMAVWLSVKSCCCNARRRSLLQILRSGAMRFWPWNHVRWTAWPGIKRTVRSHTPFGCSS